ncbi:18S rRNA (guanine-N(7))-methyltransferase RID2 [Vitis vinifera]|uniref:18S rRNA (Guanine-N(7))-methyltransferase RID2 n=1 Tax=Vitis vinifera TaxID=29760 RepID=A0A438BM10_VITVI|nr:18S rRNA (guanine-N(7))-methyltransferase RID2 [Vitis vinifera]
MSSRSELQVRPEIFYSDTEARRYVSSSWTIKIQAKLSERASELLALPDNGVSKLFIGIDCGPRLYRDALSEKRHQWIGLDILESGAYCCINV